MSWTKLASFIVGLMVSSQALSSNQCPSPAAFLGQTMAKSRDVLNKTFPNNWDANGPLCSSNYFNLMTVIAADASSSICDGPLPVQRMIVFGFDDSSRAIGLIYLLPEASESEAMLNWFSTIWGEKLERTDDYPSAYFTKLLGKRPSLTTKYLSTNRRFFLEVGAGLSKHKEILVYDLQALDVEKEALDTCMKEFRR
jgi:hypothetical protein